LEDGKNAGALWSLIHAAMVDLVAAESTKESTLFQQRGPKGAGFHDHFWGSELLYADVTGDPRHVDLLWPLWNLLDLTLEGRGTDWYPKLSY